MSSGDPLLQYGLMIFRQSQSLTQESLEVLKASMAGVKDDLEDQCDKVRDAIEVGDESIRDILQEDLESLRKSLESLERAQKVAQTARPAVVVKDNQAGDGSRILFATDTAHPNFDLTVSDNKVGVGAVSVAGVLSTASIQEAFKDSQIAQNAIAMKAMQTQSANANAVTLQSILSAVPVDRRPRLTAESQNSVPMDFTHVEGRDQEVRNGLNVRGLGSVMTDEHIPEAF